MTHLQSLRKRKHTQPICDSVNKKKKKKQNLPPLQPLPSPTSPATSRPPNLLLAKSLPSPPPCSRLPFRPRRSWLPLWLTLDPATSLPSLLLRPHRPAALGCLVGFALNPAASPPSPLSGLNNLFALTFRVQTISIASSIFTALGQSLSP